ncbi:MAG: hypothetical protein V4504_01215 [Patescibacteria group bacterium]
MLEKLRKLEENLEKFYKETKLEISKMKEVWNQKSEVPVRQSGCNLKSPSGLKNVWN